jgi:hypothetical protein
MPMTSNSPPVPERRDGSCSPETAGCSSAERSTTARSSAQTMWTRSSMTSSVASPRNWRRGHGACAAGRSSQRYPPQRSRPSWRQGLATPMTRFRSARVVIGCTGAARTASDSKRWYVGRPDRSPNLARQPALSQAEQQQLDREHHREHRERAPGECLCPCETEDERQVTIVRDCLNAVGELEQHRRQQRTYECGCGVKQPPDHVGAGELEPGTAQRRQERGVRRAVEGSGDGRQHRERVDDHRRTRHHSHHSSGGSCHSTHTGHQDENPSLGALGRRWATASGRESRTEPCEAVPPGLGRSRHHHGRRRFRALR